MEFVSFVFLLYACLPFVLGLGLSIFSYRTAPVAWATLTSSAASLLLLLTLMQEQTKGILPNLLYPIMEKAQINLSLQLSWNSTIYLLVMELVFGFYFLRIFVEKNAKTSHQALVLIAKGFIVLLLLCSNLIGIGVLQLLAAVSVAFLVRASHAPAEEKLGGKIASWFICVQSLGALLFLTWAVSSGRMTMGDAAVAEHPNFSLLLASLVLSLPLAPFFTWFEDSFRALPSLVSVILIFFVGTVLLRHLELGTTLFNHSDQLVVRSVLWLGIITIVFACGRLLLHKSQPSLYANTMQYFVGITLLAYGLQSIETVRAGMACAALLPLLLALLVSFDRDCGISKKFWSLPIFFLLVLVGFPGGPVFSVLGLLLERALSLGSYILPLVTGAWIFYFVVGIQIFRRVLKSLAEGNFLANHTHRLGLTYSGVLLFLVFTSWVALLMKGVA